MAQFGVTTALVSIFLSVFMAGLGTGSWAAGAWVRRHGGQAKSPPLRLYALAEFLIGAAALLVPMELAWGHHLLAWLAERAPIASGTYYLVSGTWLALTLILWCACMGATIPLAMFAIRRDRRYETRRSFSFLPRQCIGCISWLRSTAAPYRIGRLPRHPPRRSVHQRDDRVICGPAIDCSLLRECKGDGAAR